MLTEDLCYYFLAYWFVIVTMTTVGYGDYYPRGVAGCICAVIIMIIGFIVTALPVAIIGGNFAMVYEFDAKRRNNQEPHSVTPTSNTKRSSVGVKQAF